jgi:alanyl-tRNA synthetase
MQESRESSFARAHTAEHAFVGALQRLAGQTLSVTKVEHREMNNTAFIKTVPKLDLELIIQAQEYVNQLIKAGRRVKSYTFSSLEEAKKHFPSLRANEERIIKPQEVTLIEIENHDIAACAKDHVANLTDCDFFLVTGVSNSGSITEIDFSVGIQAREFAMHTLQKLLNICNEIGANINSVENTVKKIKNQNEKLLKDSRNRSRKSLDSLQPYTVGKGEITLYHGSFNDLMDSEIRAFADKKIISSRAVVIIANAHNSESNNSNSNVGTEQTATIVVAASESIKDIDCNKIVKEMAGRGGGKSHFASGLINMNEMSKIVNSVVTLVENSL